MIVSTAAGHRGEAEDVEEEARQERARGLPEEWRRAAAAKAAEQAADGVDAAPACAAPCRWGSSRYVPDRPEDDDRDGQVRDRACHEHVVHRDGIDRCRTAVRQYLER